MSLFIIHFMIYSIIYLVSTYNFLRDGSPRGRIAGGHCDANPTARDRDRAKLSPKTFSYTENISRLYVFSQGQRRQKQTCVQKLEHSMIISIAENKREEIDHFVFNSSSNIYS